MTMPPEPAYPSAPYPPATTSRWGDDLLAPARSRPQFARILAAVAGALLVFGMIVVLDEIGDSDGAAWAAAFVSALVVAAALAVMYADRDTPVSVTGQAVALLGVIAVVGFILETTDPDDLRGPASFFFAVTTLAWVVMFLTGPTRGRLPFLSAALAGLWLLGAVQVLGLDQGGSVDEDEPGPFWVLAPFGLAPDSTDAAGVSVLFGIAYVAVAIVLDGRGRHGAATPFIGVGDLALALGVVGLSFDSTTGAAVLGIVVGLGLAVYGAHAQRRLTAWLGAAGLLVSTISVIGETVDDGTAGGLLVVVAGALLATAAWWVHSAGVTIRIPARAEEPTQD